MLKKSLAIGLSVVMAAEVLTGCSGGSGTTETKAADTGKTEAAASEAATEGGSGEEKTLTVFHYMGQSVKQQGLEKLEEEFKKTHPNITFENIFYNQGTDYFPQLSTALASGEQPDIIMGNPATYPDLIENGYAMDLTDNDVIKNLNVSPEDLNDASANGKVYAVPIDFKASGFFYNVKMFKENGLEVPKTLTEFDQLVETLHSKGIDPFIDLYGEGSTGTKGTGHIVAASHSDHKCQCLYNGHGRKDNAYSTGGAGSQLTYKKCVSHVVNRADQHTDNSRRRKLWNDMADGGVCHFVILIMLFFSMTHINFSLIFLFVLKFIITEEKMKYK